MFRPFLAAARSSVATASRARPVWRAIAAGAALAAAAYTGHSRTTHAQASEPQPPATAPSAAAASSAASSSSASPRSSSPPSSSSRDIAILSPSESASASAPASADPLSLEEGYTMTDEQCARCEGWKLKAINKSRKVNYMLRAMDRAGCVVDPHTFISCIACAPQASGALLHKENGDMELLMCGNDRLRDFDHFETVLTHELIHAFDQCRAEVDLSNLRHHACTEIRAANLSGDCSFMRELKMVGNLDISAHQPRCVHRKAFLSLLSNPNCQTVEQAKEALSSVWDRCYTDTEPFGSVPW